ncbi:MAG TPA: SemiSWEET family transporter [Alphaproteobacteria bacterium]|nr:SemiSWEET family transporter [Alphaproteobacteria bacterium]
MKNKVITTFMCLVAVLSQVPIFIQYQTIAFNKSAKDLSFNAFFLAFTINILWLFYGKYKKDLPLILGNLAGFSLNCLMCFVIWKYG